MAVHIENVSLCLFLSKYFQLFGFKIHKLWRDLVNEHELDRKEKEEDNSSSHFFDPKLAIRDIDRPLYRYGIVYNYDNCDGIYQKYQKYKTYGIAFWLSIYIIKYFIHTFYKSLFKATPLYELEILHRLGGIAIFFYLVVILASFLALRILILFNSEIKTTKKWLNLVLVLKGTVPMTEIVILDKGLFKKFAKRIRILMFVIKSVAFLIETFLIIAFIIISYEVKRKLIYSILGSIGICFWVYYMINIVFNSILYFYIVCGYCEKSFRCLNKSILALSESEEALIIKIKSINEIISKHDILCDTIYQYNKFWKKYYLAVIITTKPLLLLLLHQIFFEELYPSIMIAVVLFSLLLFLSKVALKILTGNIAEESSNSYKLLYKVYLKLNSSLNMKQKFKV
jgi:hypothetical protein